MKFAQASANVTRRLLAYVYLARVPTSFTGSAFVFLLARRFYCLNSSAARYTAAASFLAISAGFALNDARDVTEDRVNNRWRPVARGLLEPDAAVRTYQILAVAALMCAVLSGSAMSIGVTGVMLAAISIYSFRLKRVWFVKNIFVAAAVALLPVLACGSHPERIAVWLFVPALFLWSLQKEILADVRDIDGDRRAGLVTFAMRIGRRWSAFCAANINVALWALAISWSGLGHVMVGLAFLGLAHTVLIGWFVLSGSSRGLKIYLRVQVAIVATVLASTLLLHKTSPPGTCDVEKISPDRELSSSRGHANAGDSTALPIVSVKASRATCCYFTIPAGLHLR